MHENQIQKNASVIRVFLGLGAALVALVLAGAYTAIFAPQLLADPGVLVRYGVPVVSVLQECVVALVIGGLFVTAFALPAQECRRGLKVVCLAASIWTVLAALKMVFVSAQTLGISIDDATFGEQFLNYLTTIASGKLYLTITAFAALVSLLSAFISKPPGALWVFLVALVPLVLQALMGHSAGLNSHDLAVSALLIHLIGACLWVGGLAFLVVLRPRETLPTILRRYSIIATWSLILVAISGVVSAYIRIGDASGLNSKYGVLVLIKVALITVIAGLGLAQRRLVIAKAERTGGSGRKIYARLVSSELLAMGAVIGVAVALGASEPPQKNQVPLERSAAFRLTGYELPPQPDFAAWFTQWRFDLILLLAALAGIYCYLHGVRKLRKRGDTWPWARTVLWVFGLLVFIWVSGGGPAVYGRVLFSSHMLQHMILAMVIPLFLTSAAPVTLALRAFDKRTDGSWGGREYLLAIVHSRYGAFFAHPLVAAMNFAGSMLVFYYTDAFYYSLSTHLGHLLMNVHFLLAGYFFVNALIGIDPGPSRPTYPVRLVMLLATMAFHAFFGVSLMSGDTLLVANWFGWMGRPWGASALVDQQNGGGLAWGIGEIPTVIVAIMVAVKWSQSEERLARNRDRKVERSGDTELEEYNKMLKELAKEDGNGN